MLRYWHFETLALIAALFGFTANAAVLHDLAKLSFFWGPVYDIGKFIFFGNP